MKDGRQGKSSQWTVWHLPGYPLVWKEGWPEGSYIHVFLVISKWPGLGRFAARHLKSGFTVLETLAPKGVNPFWET